LVVSFDDGPGGGGIGWQGVGKACFGGEHPNGLLWGGTGEKGGKRGWRFADGGDDAKPRAAGRGRGPRPNGVTRPRASARGRGVFAFPWG